VHHLTKSTAQGWSPMTPSPHEREERVLYLGIFQQRKCELSAIAHWSSTNYYYCVGKHSFNFQHLCSFPINLSQTHCKSSSSSWYAAFTCIHLLMCFAWGAQRSLTIIFPPGVVFQHQPLLHQTRSYESHLTTKCLPSLIASVSLGGLGLRNVAISLHALAIWAQTLEPLDV
jgi:hypothetical protein